MASRGINTIVLAFQLQQQYTVQLVPQNVEKLNQNFMTTSESAGFAITKG